MISLTILSLTVSSCAAASSVAVVFPLEGNYRVGRYMPVHVFVDATDSGATSVTLAAEGTVATELPLMDGKADAIVPWLSVRGAVGAGRWSLAAGTKALSSGPVAPALKPLADDERLVAYTDGEMADALRATAAIMPGRRVVPVRLDLTRPLLSPPAAYETVDLLLLGASAVSRVRESAVATLAAGGTAVAVRSVEKPAGDWPWRKVDAPGVEGRPATWWVLDHSPVGPRSIVDMEAYAPTYGWEHGWPDHVRRRVVLLAVLSAIPLLGLSLWRSRYAAWAAVGLCLAGAVAVILWSNRQSPLLSAGGSLVEWDGSLSQRDYWAYRSTLRQTELSVPWDVGRAPARSRPAATMLTKPVFFSPLHMQQTGVRLVCGPDGRPEQFAAHLATDATLGFLSRSLDPRKPEFRPVDRITPVTPDTAGPARDDDASSALTSPLYVLADQLYPGRVTGRVTGEEGGAPGEWQSIFIDNESK